MLKLLPTTPAMSQSLEVSVNVIAAHYKALTSFTMTTWLCRGLKTTETEACCDTNRDASLESH